MFVKSLTPSHTYHLKQPEQPRSSSEKQELWEGEGKQPGVNELFNITEISFWQFKSIYNWLNFSNLFLITVKFIQLSR